MDQERPTNPKKKKPFQRHSKGEDTGGKESLKLDCEPLRPGNGTNFMKWWRDMEILVGEKFGEIQVIFTGDDVNTVYNIVDEPERPTDEQLAPVNDPFGLRLSEYKEKHKHCIKRHAEIVEQKTKVFNYLKRHITQESWEEMRQDPSWVVGAAQGVDDALGGTVEIGREPFLLLQCARKTHTGHRTGIGAIDQERAQMSYHNIRQPSGKSLIQYKEYFTHTVRNLAALGLPVPSEANQVLKFIKGLDPARYSKLKAHYHTFVSTGSGSYPNSIADAYRIAAHHNQAPESKPTIHGVAYIAKDTNREDHTKGNYGKRIKGPWCTVHKCNDHWTNQCPEVQKLAKSLEEEDESATKVAAAAKLTKSQKYVVILHTDYSDKKRYKNYKSSKRELTLDTAANALIVKEKSLLTNLRRASMVAQIKGVGGKALTTEWIGDLPGFGTAWYHPEAVANIIPFGRVEKLYDVKYDRNLRFYFITPDGEEFNFFKIEEDDEGNGLYVYNPDAKDYLAMVTTVHDNKFGYSKREIRDAIVAKEFMRRMGYPSIKSAIEMIQSGSVTDCPVTVQDIARAQEIYGPDIAVLKGKTTKRKSKSVKFDYLPKPHGTVMMHNH